MTYTPPYTITSEILSLVAAISEAAGRLEALEPHIATPMLRKKNLVKTITGTLAIEGNTLGEEKITAILEGKRVLGSVREVEEVRGAIRVYEKLDTLDYRKEADLLNAHALLMGGILSRSGAYRTGQVGVHTDGEVIHVAPPAERVPELMGDLFAWLCTTGEHPLIVSSIFHYEFEFIHPFSDGNGRMGRLWQTLILYGWKPFFSYIPLESVVREHQEGYYRAIEASNAAGESTPFIRFMLEAILQTVKNVPEGTPQVTQQVSPQVEKLLLALEGEMSRGELMGIMALQDREHFRKEYLVPAVTEEVVELTIPDKPQSSKQKYRLTDKGKALLKQLKERQ